MSSFDEQNHRSHISKFHWFIDSLFSKNDWKFETAQMYVRAQKWQLSGGQRKHHSLLFPRYDDAAAVDICISIVHHCVTLVLTV